jgi:hypothetical protein
MANACVCVPNLFAHLACFWDIISIEANRDAASVFLADLYIKINFFGDGAGVHCVSFLLASLGCSNLQAGTSTSQNA